MDAVDVAERYEPDQADDGTSLITALAAVDLDELHPFHSNARRGSVPAIKASLAKNRQYKPIVVNRGSRTGRENEVLAGNHTLLAARDLGWKTLTVVWVDVDDEQAIRINLADNRTADLGGYDDLLLLELLSELPDLDGTGYDPGDVDALAALLDNRGSGGDDEDILNATDRAGWPTIKCQVPPDVHAQWLELGGEDDRDRVQTALARLEIG